MADRTVNTGFDPEFGGPLQRFRDALTKQGVQTNIISGVRSPQEHQMAWANYVAGRQGAALPYPDFGRVSRATPPNATSTHDIGLGSDVMPVNRADFAKMRELAPKFGLSMPFGDDPAHVQLANWQQAAGSQAQPQQWASLGDRPSQYAQNTAAPSGGGDFTVPGVTLNTSHPGFTSALINAESGGRNIANTHQGTSSGQAQGYTQITTGTWKDFAPKVGVDLNQYPNAMTGADGKPVPYDIQMRVASAIPMGRWDPITLNKLKTQGFQIDPSRTMGENAAMNHDTPYSASPIGGATSAQPGAPAQAAPPQSFADRLFKPGPPTKDAQGNDVPGKSGVEKLADSISPPKAQQAPAAPPEMQAAQVVDPTAGMAPAAQQLFQSVQQAAMKPLTWNSRPYGSMAGQQFDTPGMTLNSMGGQYG